MEIHPPSKNGHTSPLITGTHAWPPVHMLYIVYHLSSSFVPAFPFYGRGRISCIQGPNAVRHLGKICSRNHVVVFTAPAKNSLFGPPSSTTGSPENVIFNTRSGWYSIDFLPFGNLPIWPFASLSPWLNPYQNLHHYPWEYWCNCLIVSVLDCSKIDESSPRSSNVGMSQATPFSARRPNEVEQPSACCSTSFIGNFKKHKGHCTFMMQDAEVLVAYQNCLMQLKVEQL